jgi:hypothetical protein
MTFPRPTGDASAEWRSIRLLHQLYTTLAREFALDLPSCPEFELAEDAPAPKTVDAVRIWLADADNHIPVHQLRNFLQTSSMADAEHLRAILEHHLRKPQPSEADRDKADFLLVQLFSICAPSPLEDPGVGLKYVARILEPVLGTVDLVLPAALQPLEALIHGASSCRSLQELFRSGILDKGRKLKSSSEQDYFAPVALVAFARFNFLMRRAFFTLMHQDLSIILDGLRELEQRGVATLDCRSAEFSADEPVGRLRMICQSWKVMFQAEYSSGQPLRLLADLRAAVDAGVAGGAGGTGRAKAASASPTSGSTDVSSGRKSKDDEKA